MNKTFFKVGLGLVALAGLVWSSRGAETGMKALHGHVPAIISKLTPKSRMDATNQLRLAIGLPLRNQEELTNLLHELYNPASPKYRHFLSADEFTAQFAPTIEDYQSVVAFAKANGLVVEHTHPGRTLVDVVGKVTDVERAFGVQMMIYHHPTESRDFYAPSTEPTVNASLPVLSIQGINNFVQPRSMLHKKSLQAASHPAAGSGPYGTLLGSDFRHAYAPGTALDGTSQYVGLFQLDGYYATDIQAYEALAGLPNVPLQNVLLDGFDGTPGGNQGEVCLDIEMSISMAPGLAGVVVFEGLYGDDILNAMAENSQIKQLSASWGYGTDDATRQYYIQFAIQGQTYFNASGDGDAWIDGVAVYGETFENMEDPYVTVVGGTTLTMYGNGRAYASETAWNWGNVGDYNWNPDGYAGTSGGISADVAIPWYQTNINMTTNLGSKTFRNVPDVALTADNIVVVTDGGQEEEVGGTSAASPLWAGFMALVNEQAIGNGLSPIGFLAPAAYAVAQSTNYAACFHDTITGNNTWDQSTNQFFAVPGYDLCTGVGTPAGTALIDLLTGTNAVPIFPPTPVIPAPPQPWGSLTNLMGSNPNGLWFLFYQDDVLNGYSGTNYNGWMLNLTLAKPVGFPADNQLFINASNVFVTTNSQWVTTLSVTNYGPAVSSNAYVVDQLPVPSAVTLVSSSSSLPGSVINYAGDSLTWNVGSLAVNAGGTLTLTFQGNVVGTYTNGATVFSTTDPNPDDDSVGASITVGTMPAPTISPYFYPGSSKAFALSVASDFGSTVVIQASTNLVNWLPVSTNIAPYIFTNFDDTNFPYRFYRAVTGQ
jgi:subtilase family serine protease